ncbi:MAG TPA: hypothetical protein VGB87_07630 [Vicinamibacteria bacterium]
MKGLVMAGLLVAGAAALWPPVSGADWRGGVGLVVGHDAGSRGASPAFRYGYDRGWREGSEEGHRDGRRRRDPRFWREDEYRDGDRGYRRRMGPRWDYAVGFRRGYEAGYRRAYAAARHGGRDRRHDGRRDHDWW